MNGIHDMGGMHGMGPIEYEKAEPVFHEQWEGRVYALRRLTPIGRPFNLDAARHQLERIPPAEYLRMEGRGGCATNGPRHRGAVPGQ